MFIDFRERGRGRERNIDVREKRLLCYLPYALTRDQTLNLGMFPNQKLNPQPFGVQENAPTNWATWPGQDIPFSCGEQCLRFPVKILSYWH